MLLSHSSALALAVRCSSAAAMLCALALAVKAIEIKTRLSACERVHVTTIAKQV
jgi:hypothetical protein